MNKYERNELWNKVIPIKTNKKANVKNKKDKWWINNKSEKLKEKYPIYIISYNRPDVCYTYSTFRELGIEDFKVVVEPCEKEEYKKYIEEKYLHICPEDFHLKKQGSIPVRNYVWEHSIKEGHKKHWIFDDNIRGFYYQTQCHKKRCIEPNVICIAEHFFDQFDNVKMAGFNYMYFVVPAIDKDYPAFYYNTRIYSAILLDNNLKHRWRGKYNEDTDLSLRILKDGFNTILLNVFSCGKTSTLTMKGGNKDIYDETDKRKEFVEQLQKQHPGIVKMVYRYNRWHHKIDYSIFSHELILNKDFKKMNYENNLKLLKHRRTPPGKKFGFKFIPLPKTQTVSIHK